MARRRAAELPPGAEPFHRSAEQWRELGAPVFVYDVDAAAEAYVAWAPVGYGGGKDPADELVRRYYVGMIWLPRCVKPQWLAHAGALLDVEAELLASDRWARWGRPGRCRAPMLAAEADVPEWLVCCRRVSRASAS
ncbi:MAG TPA: hypothetical protein VFO16_09835 [Pseudonocardiaceae bacterium]|nr:hypothetical protein [Pseudonocardiaceae bacterium]